MSNIFFLIKSLFYLPHFFLFVFHKNRGILKYELIRYMELVLHENWNINYAFFRIITFLPDYRTVFYMRLGRLGFIINRIYPGRKNICLFVPGEKIGKGLVLHHALSSVILCKEIGEDCQIWQQVTLGKSRHTKDLEFVPTLKNNVQISAGAIVIGPVTIGNNSIVAAGAVVLKDVPDDCVVAGNPATIVRRNGIRVHEKL